MLRGSDIKGYCVALALVVAFLGVFSSDATADMFTGPITGSLASSSGGLVANGDWADSGATLTYTVALDASGNFYLYEYTLDVCILDGGVAKAISHLIFETSLDATITHFATYNQDTDPATEVVGTLYKPNPYVASGGNPGLPPAGIYGIKVEDMKEDDGADADAKKLYFSFRSIHQPMWGDFYAKDGTYSTDNTVYNYLYNAGLGKLDSPLTDERRYDYYNEELSERYVLVPDTNVVPVPGAVLLGSMGLSVAGYFLRRKRRLT